MNHSRSYIVGLPVAVEISPTGAVTLWVDTTEVSQAVNETDDTEYSDDQVAQDAEIVAEAFEADTIRANVMKAYWSDGDVVGNAHLVYRRQDGIWNVVWSDGEYSVSYPDADIADSVANDLLTIVFRKNAR